jgi:hypothetical protein
MTSAKRKQGSGVGKTRKQTKTKKTPPPSRADPGHAPQLQHARVEKTKRKGFQQIKTRGAHRALVLLNVGVAVDRDALVRVCRDEHRADVCVDEIVHEALAQILADGIL